MYISPLRPFLIAFCHIQSTVQVDRTLYRHVEDCVLRNMVCQVRVQKAIYPVILSVISTKIMLKTI